MYEPSAVIVVAILLCLAILLHYSVVISTPNRRVAIQAQGIIPLRFQVPKLPDGGSYDLASPPEE